MRLVSGIIAAVAVLLLLPASAGAQQAKWRMAKPMPQPAGEIVSAVAGNKWYVFGGYDGINAQPQGIVAEYDPAADSWTMKKNMLLPAHHAAELRPALALLVEPREGCVAAERNDMDKAMTYLSKAFSLKANSNPGEKMPDPRRDDSFQRFMSNAQFRKLADSLEAPSN